MRLAIVCSGLDPGRDGVGDYARGLAEEVASMGHSPLVIALNDRSIFERQKNTREASGDGVDTFRLPATSSWADRVGFVRSQLRSFQADWVSLQFVCYGFQRKGMVCGVARHIREALGTVPVQMMFHELWIGEERGAALAKRIMGSIQRLCVKRLVRELGSKIYHTSNHAYRTLLRAHGIESELLPMFGSVPVRPSTGRTWIENEFRDSIAGRDRRDTLVFGIFGALHLAWPPRPLLTRLASMASWSAKKVVIASIGRIGEGESVWSDMKKHHGSELAFVRLGEQPTGRVGEFLQFIDYGIATTPLQIIGKSSTVAAMLEYGVPVIVNREDAHFRLPVPEASEPLLLRCDANLELRLMRGGMRGAMGSRRRGTARKLLTDLSDALN